jgi:diguanylate cyclase (GGDEF)-like protein
MTRPDEPDGRREHAARVLVVDDSAIVRKIIAGYLRGAGHHVGEAPDGADAFVQLEAERFDVVLTDLQMPVLDGFGLLDGIRSRSLDAEVIILTGSEDMESAVRALRAGAHDFLRKPPSGALEVVLTVERAAEKKRLRETNLRLMRELKALSRRDALTGLFNRRVFDETLQAETTRSRRYRLALSLVILDLDHFKLINDRHGHPAGDTVLKLFAGIARGQTRDGDALCRYGGEEFAALLAHTPLEGALDVARRLVASTAKTPFVVGAASVGVTVSAGVAALDASDETGLAMLAAADAALYEAKRAGRNQARAVPVSPVKP